LIPTEDPRKSNETNATNVTKTDVDEEESDTENDDDDYKNVTSKIQIQDLGSSTPSQNGTSELDTILDQPVAQGSDTLLDDQPVQESSGTLLDDQPVTQGSDTLLDPNNTNETSTQHQSQNAESVHNRTARAGYESMAEVVHVEGLGNVNLPPQLKLPLYDHHKERKRINDKKRLEPPSNSWM
jgi:hypothetical protein